MNFNWDTYSEDSFDRAVFILEKRILNLLHICKNKDKIKGILLDLTPLQINNIYTEALEKEMYEICQAVTEIRDVTST